MSGDEGLGLLNLPTAKARGGSICEFLQPLLGSHNLLCRRAPDGYNIQDPSRWITHDTDRGANFLGRPALTRAAGIAAKG